MKRGAKCMKWNKKVNNLVKSFQALFQKGKCRAYLRGVEIFRALVYVYHIVAADGITRGYIYIYTMLFL